MLKPNRREKKIAGGIALYPSLWERIDRLALDEKVSRSAAMELILDRYVPQLEDFSKSKWDGSDREIEEEGIF